MKNNQGYQFAISDKGPWLDMWPENGGLGATIPEVALEEGRGMFDAEFIYVAKMVPLDATDLMPKPSQFWGDMKERVYDLYGSAVVDQLEYAGGLEIYEGARKAVDAYLGEAKNKVLAPKIVRRYGPNETVRARDFAPSLKALMR